MIDKGFMIKVVSPRLQAFASLGCLLPVLNLPKAFQTIPMLGIVCLLHLSPTYKSKLLTLSLNEEAPTLCVEALWSRQESNLDLVFRKHLFYPLNYGTIGYLVAEDSKNNHIIWYLYASNTTQYGFLQYHY